MNENKMIDACSWGQCSTPMADRDEVLKLELTSTSYVKMRRGPIWTSKFIQTSVAVFMNERLLVAAGHSNAAIPDSARIRHPVAWPECPRSRTRLFGPGDPVTAASGNVRWDGATCYSPRSTFVAFSIQPTRFPGAPCWPYGSLCRNHVT